MGKTKWSHQVVFIFACMCVYTCLIKEEDVINMQRNEENMGETGLGRDFVENGVNRVFIYSIFDIIIKIM